MNDAVKEISIEFKNFMVGEIDESISYRGVYYVCAMQRNPQTGNSMFSRLLYVGMSNDERGIYGRYLGHDDKAVWLRQLMQGEYLGFFTAEIEDVNDLPRAEAALIYAFKPPLNVQHKDNFGYSITRVNISNVWGLKKTKELLGRYVLENH